MGRWPLWWGAPALAFVLTFMVVARGSDVAIPDDDAHRRAPWVLLVTGAIGAGTPLLRPKDETAVVCARWYRTTTKMRRRCLKISGAKWTMC